MLSRSPESCRRSAAVRPRFLSGGRAGSPSGLDFRSVILSGARVQRSGTPAESKDLYPLVGPPTFSGLSLPLLHPDRKQVRQRRLLAAKGSRSLPRGNGCGRRSVRMIAQVLLEGFIAE